MTGLPTLIVECAFGTAPDAVTPTWTDISAYVWPSDGQSWSHGRPDEFSQCQPGTMSLTLNNVDGRFTSGYPSSPYYPNVLMGRRIRASEVWAGITYRRFDGTVDAWPTEWPTGTNDYAEVKITATDRFKRLARARKLNGVLQEEALTDSPKGLWPMSDPAESTAVSDLSGRSGPLTWRREGIAGTYEFGSATAAGTDGLTGLLLTPTTTQGYYLAAVTSGITESQSLELWFNTSRSPAAQGLIALRDPTYYLAAYMSAGGGVAVSSYPHTIPVIGTATAYNDGITHHLAVTRTRVGDVFTTKLYMDGLLTNTNTTTLTGFTAYPPTAVYVGGMWPTASFLPFQGTLSNASIYDGALSAARVLAHYQAGATGGFAESTGVRIGRWARYLGIPTALLNLDAGAGSMGTQQSAGQDALTLMQDAATVENAPLFVAGDGRLRLRARTIRYNAASTFTLTADDLRHDLRFTTDDFGLANDVAYTRTGGATAVRTNAASITANGDYSDQVTLSTSVDAEAAAAADWRIANYSIPVPRLSTVTVDLDFQTSSSVIASVLAAEVGDKFTITGLPPQAPASSVTLFIEGITENLSSDGWSVTFTTSPGTVGQDLWKIEDATYGALDSSHMIAL